MAFKVTIDNLGKFKSAIDAMRKQVYVGVPSVEDKRSGGKVGNADLAYIHDRGSPANNIPARPFMEPGMLSAKESVLKALEIGASDSFSDVGALDKALNKAGLIAQTSIKKTIVSGSGFAGLSDKTIKARKRRGLTRTKPLIDTGSLLNSISYVVK